MLMHRRALLVAAFALAAASSVATATAQERRPFDMKSFREAQAQGKPILVEVYAPWCPTCRRQQPIIGELSKTKDFARMQIYTLDFDNQKDALKALRVNGQSTLIAFKGSTETNRSVGVTDRVAIEELMRSAL